MTTVGIDKEWLNEREAICDRFEAAWKAGTPQPIEHFISSVVTGDHRGELVFELIQIEIHYRKDLKRPATIADYRERFPELKEEIEGLFLEPTVLAKDRRELVASLPQSGQLIGDFEIIEKLKSGGMGVVYKARQVSVKRLAALKVIRSGDAANTKEIERFINEAEAAAKLEHSGIVPIFGSGSQDGQHYLAMAFIDGPSLAERVAQGPMPAREAAELIRRVALAVDYAHRQGVIHRDLKPGNILLATVDQTRSEKSDSSRLTATEFERRPDEETASGNADNPVGITDTDTPNARIGETPPFGKSSRPASSRRQKTFDAAQLPYEPKVTDFGLAKLLGADRELTTTGEILGTPEYMSPEQASGRMSNVGAATDIYALGAILYRLFTGRPPFYDENPIKLLKQLTDTDPVEPHLLSPGLSRDLETICLKCLEKTPSHRFSSAAELAEELDRFLRGEPIHSRPVTQWERAKKWCQRNTTVAILSTCVGLALLIGTIFSSYFAIRESRINHLSERQLYVARMNLAQSAWEDMRVGRVRQLLQQYAPETANENLRGFEWFYWNRLCHRDLQTLSGHTAGVCCVAYSPDGSQMVTASFDRTLKLWDVASGRVVETFAGHSKPVRCVAFSPDGTRIASGSDDETVKLWDVVTKKEIRSLKGHKNSVVSVAFHPDNALIATASQDRTIKLWNVFDGRETQTLTAHSDEVRCVAFSPDGQQLASASDDGAVKLWDVGTMEEVTTLRGHDRAWCVAFSPDGKWIASAGVPNVQLWEASTGQLAMTLKGHKFGIMAVAFSRDSKRLASASWDETVKLWDVTEGNEIATLQGHASHVAGVAFQPDGTRIATASFDQTVKLWDTTPDAVTVTLRGHRGTVTSVAFSPDGTRLVSGSHDRTLRLWDVNTPHTSILLEGHTGWVTSVAFSPDGTRIASASGSGDHTVRLWDVLTGHEVATLYGHTNLIESVAFSHDGSLLASASNDHTVKLWDMTSGREIRTLTGHTDWVKSVAFSPDGAQLASASNDRSVKLWDVKTGRENRTLNGHSESVTSVAFNRDGTWIATGSGDSTVMLWDTRTGKEVKTLLGHTDVVRSVAFSPDDARLVTASQDGMVKLWDTVTRQDTLSLKEHGEYVTCAAFSPDGFWIASGGYDATVKLWDGRSLIQTKRVASRISPNSVGESQRIASD